MNITSEDEALLELFENGKTSDKKYKRLPIAAIKGYVKAVNKMNLKVPFIMTKGNHDITGPGAKEAFEKVYLPNMARLAGHPSLQSANYTTTLDDVLFVCYDPWDRNPEGLQQLEKSLAGSKATYKFVMLHELVIPVNERCWHVFRQDNAKRMQLEYYAAFGEKPYDTVNISELLTSN